MITSTYNDANLLSMRQFSDGSSTLRFDQTYNDRNQLEEVIRYSDLAGTTKVGESDYSYDDQGRLENINHKNGSDTTLAELTYTYDALNRVKTEVLDGTTKTFTYDERSQLLDDSVTSYSYDDNGNRDMAGYQTTTGNRMTNDGTYTYTYDAEGNTIKKSMGASLETWVYEYDFRNQLIDIEKQETDGGTVLLKVEYEYDVFGRRIQEDKWTSATGTVTTKFAYDGANVWAELDDAEDLQTRYVRPDGIDALAARVDSTPAVAWYLVDQLGSVVGLTDSSGIVQDRIYYDGFGRITSETNAAYGGRLKFTGKDFDSDTGLQHNWWRYYDSATGRWTTEDPKRFGARDPNLFRYVGNNPTNSRDPNGLEKMPEDEFEFPYEDLIQSMMHLANAPFMELERQLRIADVTIGLDDEWNIEDVEALLLANHPDVLRWMKERNVRVSTLPFSYWAGTLAANYDGKIVNGTPVLKLRQSLTNEEAVNAIVGMTRSVTLDTEISADFNKFTIDSIWAGKASANAYYKNLSRQIAAVGAGGAQAIRVFYASLSGGVLAADILIDIGNGDVQLEDLAMLAPVLKGVRGNVIVKSGGRVLKYSKAQILKLEASGVGARFPKLTPAARIDTARLAKQLGIEQAGKSVRLKEQLTIKQLMHLSAYYQQEISYVRYTYKGGPTRYRLMIGTFNKAKGIHEVGLAVPLSGDYKVLHMWHTHPTRPSGVASVRISDADKIVIKETTASMTLISFSKNKRKILVKEFKP